jgi:predicted homoserine dehydrogenase-like protein
MIIVDKALERRQEAGEPIRVGMIGAGFMGRGVALNMIHSTPGMELVAISNRNLEGAKRAYREAGVEDFVTAETVDQVDRAVRQAKRVVTEDFSLLTRTENIDAVVEVTGHVAFGAEVIVNAIRNRKHVITMNAEVDATVGPYLKVLADRERVVYTGADGDQPGVIINLYRFVKGIGVKPVLCGNIKGLHDPYRNPTTQEAFAKRWGQKAHMVTSFADGSKVSIEQAIVANATGMRVAKRGMHGPTVPSGTPIDQISEDRFGRIAEIGPDARPSCSSCSDTTDTSADRIGPGSQDSGRLGSGRQPCLASRRATGWRRDGRSTCWSRA